MHGHSVEVRPLLLLFTITLMLENDLKYHIPYVIAGSTHNTPSWERKRHIQIINHYLMLFIESSHVHQHIYSGSIYNDKQITEGSGVR